jgi:hypothetical protein
MEKVDEYLPQNIRDNLNNMPNDTGYIWRDIYYYGAKPPKNVGYVEMFEKQQRGPMLIHEFHPNKVLVFEKLYPKGRKLLSEVPRSNPFTPKYSGIEIKFKKSRK